MEESPIRSAILTFAAVAPLSLMLLWKTAPWTAIAIIFASHMLVLYPTLRPSAQWLGPVITRFHTDRREVWLTIDDGPTPDTVALLDLLDRFDARATFFVKGKLVDANRALAGEIVRRGHSIANHSQTHPSGTFWCLGPGRIAREIDGCNRAIAEIAGTKPTWFRAPVGMKNPFVHPLLAERDMTLIGWSARGFDAVFGDPESVKRRVLRSVRPGAIVLMHQGRETNLQSMELLLDALTRDGYRFSIPDPSQFIAE